jgi:antitoxin component of MazEF toxin-antitoxin module
MTKHLTQHGNSAALIIDKPILALLNITMTTPLEISTDGRSLVISPSIEKSRQKKFSAAMASVNTLHGKTLRKLAK